MVAGVLSLQARLDLVGATCLHYHRASASPDSPALGNPGSPPVDAAHSVRLSPAAAVVHRRLNKTLTISWRLSQGRVYCFSCSMTAS
jgi:hypothetical protein